MNTRDVTLVTCEPLPEPDPDMQIIQDALDERGMTSRVRVWNASNVDWSASPVTLIRSTWDYYHDRDSYLQWAAHVDDVSSLINPLEIVEWNSHKNYLLDLQSRGLPVVPTVLVPHGEERRLADICDARDWTKIVVKPAVSAASFQTHVVDCDHLDEALFERLVANRDMLVQPYVPEVESHGERSVIAIDAQISHCVRKSPRYHGEPESISGPIETSKEQTELARSALDMVGQDLLYARVDMVQTESRGPLITELELIEPSLFLDYADDGAAAQMAEALAARVTESRAARDKSSRDTSPVQG